MSLLGILDDEEGRPPRWQDQFAQSNQRDLSVQVAISVVFGLSAFISFCILRPKWTELYHARKKHSNAASRLPDLPKSLFGWIPVLYRISEEEVLASAGLDAFAFLSFFRYAIRYLCVTLFFSLTIILPVNYKYTGDLPFILRPNSTDIFVRTMEEESKPKIKPVTQYLWMYVAFAYFFTWVAIYLLVAETKRIIRIRQGYLGTQSTVTDRTIRLSGIPVDMRSEEKITSFIEELGIGKVEYVMLCRDWRKLDELTDERMCCLRRLEESWAAYLGPYHSSRRTKPPQRDLTTDVDDEEQTALLSGSEIEQAHVSTQDGNRPMHTIHYGRFNLRSKKVDAIDYYEERLRQYDEKVRQARSREFQPMPLAFVTMESTAACQMAVQAILDPTPGQFIASLAPPPADVVWRNTYLSRNQRMFRSWTIMIFIGFLTIFWAVLLIPLAGLLSIEVIEKVLPGLADLLEAHPIVRSLVQTGLPTLVFSLLSIGVPYLYDWLSNCQGMTSQGDVELSVISKNYFFTFFNLFIVFTIWGSASTLYDFWQKLKDILQDTTAIAYAVAKSLEQLSPFYVNLIVLQGLGLFPFRLLEFGAVALYPFYLISAKTPRDHAELVKPPVFSYGFFLPQSILIFVICLIYSVLPRSWMITLFGLVYFLIGGFIYKYQLLYAMDHQQHSTGRAWPMICNRIFVGLAVFQIAMTGILALKSALTASVFLVPLLVTTIWYSIYFARTFHPLMRFIALRSIDRVGPLYIPEPSDNPWFQEISDDRNEAGDSDPDRKYVNPNLVAPLEELWIRKSGGGQSGGHV